MADNIEIMLVDRERDDWRMLLNCWRQFWNTEVLRSAIPEFKSTSSQENLEEMLEKMYYNLDGPLIVAFDRHQLKVAGYVMCQMKRRNVDSKGQEPGATGNISDFHWKDVSKKQIEGFNNFAAKLTQVDILDRYEVDEAARLLELSVAKEYGKRQLGYKLVKKTIEVLQEQRIPVIYSYFSSAFSQRVGMKCGFECIEEFEYGKSYDLFADIPEEIIKYHKSCAVMSRKI